MNTASKPKHSWLRALAREPFFQFMLLGLLIWAGLDYRQSQETRYDIEVGATQRQRIGAAYQQQFGQPPTADQLQSLIDRHIREEIYLREGLALNLDRDDEIVRRRIVQKYEFLQTDLAIAQDPESAELERWFGQHETRYRTPQRIAFSHIYFSVDRDGEQQARQRAANVLEKLRGMQVSRAPNLGDAFPGPTDVGALAQTEAAKLFGRSELSEKLFASPVGQWSGPYRSGYGWHLVHVSGELPPELPPLSDIRERVLADYLDEQRRVFNERVFEQLRAKYEIRGTGAVQ